MTPCRTKIQSRVINDFMGYASITNRNRATGRAKTSATARAWVRSKNKAFISNTPSVVGINRVTDFCLLWHIYTINTYPQAIR